MQPLRIASLPMSPAGRRQKGPQMTDLQKSRLETHGDFHTTSDIFARFEEGAESLPFRLRYAYIGIAIKMARILNGDPLYEDHWRDIAGYAEEAVKIINDAKGESSRE